MGAIIGADPKQWAKNQVNLRQKLLGADPRPPDVLEWITSNTSWIRASSPVNIIREGEEIKVNDGYGNEIIDRKIQKSLDLTGSPNYTGRKLAREYVLFGGVTSLKETKDAGTGIISYSPNPLKGGVANSYSLLGNENVYGSSASSEKGLVPMPGIISLSVDTYNRGSLRKVEFKVKANNKQQFAIIDSLFMRPGFTILIEWGNTIYYKSPPNSEGDPIRQTANFDTPAFAKLMGDQQTYQEEILASIANERDRSEGNYDGFFGKITNFKWDYQEDGSYDISISAVSIGDVIESLTINRVLKANLEVDKGVEITGRVVNTNIQQNTNNTAEPSFKELSFKKGNKTVKVKIPNYGKSNYDSTLTYPIEIYGNVATTKIYKRVEYKEFWDNWDLVNPTEAEQLYRNSYGGTNGTTIGFSQPNNFAAYQKYRAAVTGQTKGGPYNNFTLPDTTPPPTYTKSTESQIGDDVLIVEAEKSLMNRFLYGVYSSLKDGIAKKGVVKNLTDPLKKPATKNSAGSTIKFYSNELNLDLADPDTVNKSKEVLMIQPLTEIITKNEAGRVVKTELKAAKLALTQYMTLRALLGFIERELLMYDDKGGTINPHPYITFDTTDLFCYTFPEQFSANPLVCIIPFKTKDEKGEFNRSYMYEICGDGFKGTGSDFVGRLDQIHINLTFIAKCLNSSKENDGVALLKFLEALLQGIQQSLGNINQFSVTYDHDENTIKIIDNVPLDPKITGTNTKPDERTFFEVNGYKRANTPYNNKPYPVGSFVDKVGITSQLSSNFATMIAIGAQSRSSSELANATAFTRWNEGLTDCVIESKLSRAVADPSNKENSTAEQLFQQNRKLLFETDGTVITNFYEQGIIVTEEVMQSAENFATELFRYQSAIYNIQNDVPSVQGFIPFNLNLDLDGFSGLRIYERFQISSEILPPGYPEALSFIVKGIKHNIDSSGWKTTIDSLSVQSAKKESYPVSSPTTSTTTP
jgi:hypothetical protein